MTDKFFDDADSIPVEQAASGSFFDDSDSVPAMPERVGDAKNVSFGGYTTSQIPILGSISNALGAGGATLVEKLQGDPRAMSDIYSDEKAQYDADLKAYAKQNPGLGITGTLLGGAALPGAGGGLVRQVALNSGTAAVDAGLKGENMGTAGLISGGVTAALGGAGRALNSLPSLRDYAARRAVKAAGAMTKEMRSLNDKGLLEDTGRDLLDNGIVKLGSSLEDIAEAAAKAKEKAGEAIGAAIEKADEGVNRAKEFISQSSFFKSAPEEMQKEIIERVGDSFGFSSNKVADRISQELIAPNAGNPMLAGEVKKLQKLVDEFSTGGSKSLKEGLGIKSSQRRLTNFDSETVPQGFKQDVYKIVKEELEAGVGQASKIDQAVKNLTPDEMADAILFGKFKDRTVLSDVAEGPAGEFAKANRQYAIMANTEDMAKKRFGMAQSNREMSPSDYATAGLGMIQGGPVGAVALGALNKAARRYGSSTAAVAANETAKMLEASPQALKTAAGALRDAVSGGNAAKGTTNLIRDIQRPSPAMIPQMTDQSKDESGANKIKNIIQTNPQALGKYGPVLKSAMDRGGNAYSVTHFLLQQKDPEYRELMRALEKDESH